MVDKVKPEHRWGFDESGNGISFATCRRVLGPRGKSIQHDQQPENRELVTSIEFINAVGKRIPPFFIFKRANLNEIWFDDQINPIDAT